MPLPAFSDYRALIHYGRFSSPRQAAGSSEDRQLDKADQWAAANGVTFTNRLIDRGLSGFHGTHRKRGDFGTLLQLVKEQRIPTPALLVLAEGDRAGREDVDIQLESLVLGLLRGGIDLLVVESGLHLNLERWRADLGAQIQLQALLHGANQYSRRLAERMRYAHQQGRDRIKAGEIVRPGWAPSWIDLVDGAWQFNSYADTIRRMLQLLQTCGYNSAAKRLNAEGLLTPRGKAWTAGAVTHLAQSPAIAGGRVLKRRDPEAGIAWDYYPALLSRPAWEALKQRILNRDGSPSHGGNQELIHFIGQGCSICNECGRPVGQRMSSYRHKGERRVIRNVRCRGRGDGRCSSPALPLEDVTLSLLARLTIAQLSRLFPADNSSTITTLRNKVTALQQQQDEHRATAAAGQQQITKLLTTAPDLVEIVAREVQADEQQADLAAQQLLIAQDALHSAESTAGQRLSEQLAQQVNLLQMVFLTNQDTPEHRRLINQLLRQLPLRIHVDAHQRRLGLQIGDGLIDWQPIAADLARITLHQGGGGLQVNPDGSASFHTPD